MKHHEIFIVGVVIISLISALLYFSILYIVKEAIVIDTLIHSMIFSSVFVLVFTALFKGLKLEGKKLVDERTRFIDYVSAYKAMTVWLYTSFTIVLILFLMIGLNIIKLNMELLGFLKGLWISAIALPLVELFAWIKTYRKYS